MIIMIEGPDLAGKTTLAQQIKRRIKNSEVVHRGPPTGTWEEEYLQPLVEMREHGGAYILDRWHWGEMIYGPLLRGESLVDDEALAVLEAKCTEYGVSRVLLLPKLSVLEERWKDRGDALISLTQLMDIAAAYQRLLLQRDKFTINFIGTEPPDARVVGWLIASALQIAEESGWKV